MDRISYVSVENKTILRQFRPEPQANCKYLFTSNN